MCLKRKSQVEVVLLFDLAYSIVSVKYEYEILLCLQANKLACHIFMNAGRRHKTPGSKIKDRSLLAVIAVDGE